MCRLYCLALIFIFVGCCHGTVLPTGSMVTTSASHSGHIGESLHFAYQPATHHMILTRGSDCFIAKLTHDDYNIIHTNGGVKVRILRSLGNATTIAATDVNTQDVKLCRNGHDHYYFLHV